MDIAKSMYSGGAIVRASEMHYSDFARLGLRCLECGEPVILKRGSQKRTHFAHHPKTFSGHRQCSLRELGNIKGWQGVSCESKDQRLELFQEHFMKLISEKYINFSEKIELARKAIKSIECEFFVSKNIEFYHNYYQKLIRECEQVLDNSNNKLSILHILICSEAIDYLALLSNKNILESFVFYILCEIKLSTSQSWQECVTQTRPLDLVRQIKKIILKTPWESHFSEITRNIIEFKKHRIQPNDQSNKPKIINNYQKINTDLIDLKGHPSSIFLISHQRPVKVMIKGVDIYLMDGSPYSFKKILKIAEIKKVELTNNCISVNWEFACEYTEKNHIKKSETLKSLMDNKIKLINEITSLLKQKIKSETKNDITMIESNSIETEFQKTTESLQKKELKEKEEQINIQKEETKIKQNKHKKLLENVKKYSGFQEDQFIECPEPNCSAKLKVKNLKNHLKQSHSEIYE